MNVSQLFNGTNTSTPISSTPSASALPIFGYAVGGIVAIVGFYYTYQLCRGYCNRDTRRQDTTTLLPR